MSAIIMSAIICIATDFKKKFVNC